MRYFTDDELYHHGVKGMKWGVRRYVNEDGTLTSAGKKRISKKYKKHAMKAKSQVVTEHNYFKAYNATADKMNNGLIDKYNSDYEKKLGPKAKGHDYLNDKEYNDGYEKMWNEIFTKTYNSILKEEYRNNRHFKKAEELSKKYGMVKWDELAKRNYYNFKGNLVNT